MKLKIAMARNCWLTIALVYFVFYCIYYYVEKIDLNELSFYLVLTQFSFLAGMYYAMIFLRTRPFGELISTYFNVIHLHSFVFPLLFMFQGSSIFTKPIVNPYKNENTFLLFHQTNTVYMYVANIRQIVIRKVFFIKTSYCVSCGQLVLQWWKWNRVLSEIHSQPSPQT